MNDEEQTRYIEYIRKRLMHVRMELEMLEESLKKEEEKREKGVFP